MPVAGWLFVLIVSLLQCSAAENYCGEDICGRVNEHTLCHYKPGPGPLCTNYVSHPLSEAEKERIVRRLNKRRKDAASKRLMNFSTAANMMKLHWADELAVAAQRWADQCQPPDSPELNDSCRDLKSITVGQTVASVVGAAPGLRVETMVDIWYLQSLYYKGNASVYVGLTQSSTSTYYGDFAQIVWSNTYLVGCGMSQFESQVHGQQQVVYRLVCNFAPRGPPELQPLWSPGAPASNCPPNSSVDNESRVLCEFHIETDKYLYSFKKYLEIEHKMTTTEAMNIKSFKTNKRNKKSVRKEVIGLDDDEVESTDPLTLDIEMDGDSSFEEVRYDSLQTNQTMSHEPILGSIKNEELIFHNVTESVSKYSSDSNLALESIKGVKHFTKLPHINKTNNHVFEDLSSVTAIVNNEVTNPHDFKAELKTSNSNVTSTKNLTIKEKNNINKEEKSKNDVVNETIKTEVINPCCYTDLQKSTQETKDIEKKMVGQIAQSTINGTMNGELGAMELIPENYYDYVAKDIFQKDRRSLMDILFDLIGTPINKYKKRPRSFSNKAHKRCQSLLVLLLFVSLISF